MFQYVNHRFCLETISFQIPNDYYFDSEPGEESDNFMRLWSPDKTFSMWIYITPDCTDTKKSLMDVLKNIEPHYSSGIKEITINGLNGHQTTYYMSQPQYYEAWLQITDDSALTIIIESKKDILELDISEIFAGIDLRRND